MLQSPGVELGQAELGLQELSASFPWAPSPLGRSLGPWVSQGGPPAGLLQARRVPPGLGTSCSGSTCLGGLPGALDLPLCRRPASAAPPPQLRGSRVQGARALSCGHPEFFFLASLAV